PDIVVTGLDNRTIKAVRVRTQVTATSLTASTASARMELTFIGLSTTLVDLVNLSGATRTPLVGATMGTSAGTSSDLVFAEGSPPFSTATAPYNGTFAPYRAVLSPDGTFGPFKGSPANGWYNLYASHLDAPVTFQCFVMELDLQ